MAETPDETPPNAPSELESVRAKLGTTEQELNNYKLRLADFENAQTSSA